jgi:hypothetical protein
MNNTKSMKSTKRLMPFVLSVAIFACPIILLAQSGGSPVTTATPANKEAPIPTPAQADATALELRAIQLRIPCWNSSVWRGRTFRSRIYFISRN